MSGKKVLSSVWIPWIILLLVVGYLFLFGHLRLPAEFFSSFAGALAALLFSAVISYYFWRKTQKQTKNTKAQILQSLMNEVELNLNNIANFIKGCRDGTFFQPFIAASAQKNLFWPRILTDYPHLSFELTQYFDLIYSTFFLMQYYATELQMFLPENVRFLPMTVPPPPEPIRTIIRQASANRFGGWRLLMKTSIDYYDGIVQILKKEFSGFNFRKQLYFEENQTYEKLGQFIIEI
jgi:hypothetical protein